MVVASAGGAFRGGVGFAGKLGGVDNRPMRIYRLNIGNFIYDTQQFG
jgi:hypothetical protein